MVDMNEAIKEAYENAPQDVVYYDTLEIMHSSFEESIKLVRSWQPIETLQGTFLPLLFDFTLPETEGGVRGEMTITLTLISRALRELIRSASGLSTKIEIKYRQYLAPETDPDAEIPVNLQIAGIQETPSAIIIRAMFPDLVGLSFPRRIMMASDLPGAIV